MAGESKKLYAEDDISKLAVLKSTDSIPQKVNNHLLQGVQKFLELRIYRLFYQTTKFQELFLCYCLGSYIQHI